MGIHSLLVNVQVWPHCPVVTRHYYYVKAPSRMILLNVEYPLLQNFTKYGVTPRKLKAGVSVTGLLNRWSELL